MVGDDDSELADVATGSACELHTCAIKVSSALGEHVRLDLQRVPLLHGLRVRAPCGQTTSGPPKTGGRPLTNLWTAILLCVLQKLEHAAVILTRPNKLKPRSLSQSFGKLGRDVKQTLQVFALDPCMFIPEFLPELNRHGFFAHAHL